MQVTIDGFVLPIKKLKGTDPVDSLDFSNKRLGSASVAVIASLIGNNASLSSIVLAGNRVGSEGAAALAPAIAASSSLTSLDLEGNYLHAEGAKALVDGGAFKGSLTSLNLRYNDLRAEGAKALVDGGAFKGSSTAVDVGFNEIGKEAALDLIRIFTKKENMISVGLAECGIASEEAGAVVKMIQVCSSLTECNLRRNNLGVEGWTIIFNALRDSPSSKITKWDLSQEFLGPEIAKPLAEYISVASSLTACDLRYNGFDEPAKQLLRDSVKDRPSFKLEL